MINMKIIVCLLLFFCSLLLNNCDNNQQPNSLEIDSTETENFNLILNERNGSLIKLKEKFLYDSCYIRILEGIPSNHALLAFNNNGRVVCYKSDENFENFLYSSQTIFNWDQLTKENIKVFFVILMLQYHNYGNPFPTDKNEFIDYISNFHQMTYEISGNTITLNFWFIDWSKKLKHNVRLMYRGKNKFQIDYLDTTKITPGDPIL